MVHRGGCWDSLPLSEPFVVFVQCRDESTSLQTFEVSICRVPTSFFFFQKFSEFLNLVDQKSSKKFKTKTATYTMSGSSATEGSAVATDMKGLVGVLTQVLPNLGQVDVTKAMGVYLSHVQQMEAMRLQQERYIKKAEEQTKKHLADVELDKSQVLTLVYLTDH